MRLLWIAITSVAISLAAASCGGVPEDTGTEVDPVDQGVVQAPAAGAGTTKVTICHVPPGNPANAHTITVGAPAVKAHLAHGDTIGACGSGVDGGGGGGGESDGGSGGGGGGCGAIGDPCTGLDQCCAGLACVDDAANPCTGGFCTCRVVIN